MHTMKKTIEELAELLYERYCRAVGGVAFNGDPLPNWATFTTDPNKQKQASGWRAVAEAACDELEP